jgi:hypothetical protein
MIRGSRFFVVCVVVMLLAVRWQPADAAGHNGYLYASSSYDALYQDMISSLSLYDPLRAGLGTRPYLQFDVNTDTRSRGGYVPQVYNDNYALAAAGMEFMNSKGFRAAAQLGLTAQVGSAAAHPSGGDIRVSTSWFRGWGGPAASRHWYGNFSTGANYLSRYHVATAWSGIELGSSLRANKSRIDLFARGDGYFETNAQYYPPSIDGSLGMRLRSARGTGFALEFSEKAGSYLRAVSSRASNFSGYQAMLTYGSVL